MTDQAAPTEAGTGPRPLGELPTYAWGYQLSGRGQLIFELVNNIPPDHWDRIGDLSVRECKAIRRAFAALKQQKRIPADAYFRQHLEQGRMEAFFIRDTTNRQTDGRRANPGRPMTEAPSVSTASTRTTPSAHDGPTSLLETFGDRKEA